MSRKADRKEGIGAHTYRPAYEDMKEQVAGGRCGVLWYCDGTDMVRLRLRANSQKERKETSRSICHARVVVVVVVVVPPSSTTKLGMHT